MDTGPVYVFTLFAIGFSIFSAAILLVAYLFFLRGMSKTTASKIACTALLLALSCLQFYHFGYLVAGSDDLFSMRPYVLLLLATPSTFYFFSREILFPEPSWSYLQALHGIPVILGLFSPVAIVVPFAFVIGAGYSVWFARVVYGMRRHSGRFRFEMFFFSFFAVLAICVLILFLLIPYLEAAVFYVAYANFTGIALALIVATLIIFPELLSDFAEAAKIAYAKSTLNDVSVDDKLAELERAMGQDKLFQDEGLSLKVLAAEVGLSSHQLSELINTRFGMSFSRYVRECRVVEAKRLLSEQSDASILSISMETGFRSQSNFYAAFKEIVGVSPGQYRNSPD